MLNGFLHRVDSLDSNSRAKELCAVVRGEGGRNKLVGFGDIGVPQSSKGRRVTSKTDGVGHESRCDGGPDSGEERRVDQKSFSGVAGRHVVDLCRFLHELMYF